MSRSARSRVRPAFSCSTDTSTILQAGAAVQGILSGLEGQLAGLGVLLYVLCSLLGVHSVTDRIQGILSWLQKNPILTGSLILSWAIARFGPRIFPRASLGTKEPQLRPLSYTLGKRFRYVDINWIPILRSFLMRWSYYFPPIRSTNKDISIQLNAIVKKSPIPTSATKKAKSTAMFPFLGLISMSTDLRENRSQARRCISCGWL